MKSSFRSGAPNCIAAQTLALLNQITVEDLRQLAEFAERRFGSVPQRQFSADDAVQKALFSKPEPRTKLRAATIQLMDFVYEVANYGEHAAEVGEQVPVSFAISACSAVVELCHHLADDLASKPPVGK